MKQRNLVVVSAGLSQPSSTRLLADQLSAAVVSAAADGDVELTVQVIELRDLAHDIANHLLTGFPPAALKDALDAVAAADALIAVSPIFTASYSGLFKSFFDVLDKDALTGKPVLIAATAGTARHSLALEHALRPLFAYLHAVVVPTSVFAASDDWGADSADGMLRSRITRAASELARELASREPVTVVDPFALTVDFKDLL
ncbi:CE1759 family FMN reductase [Paractinoplanes atraurantiacus]|uniref:FMN reductase n=1 Tax=Paractinoplanes atraurantiacus TaxID=1036182 RepID=A0A285IPZ1_9ACTN|nr:CE1759 family FMN reductase [Actinoplanes atraurantiacus]SNY49021.1 FMN reductase [Actinoplanes atraurantiacus]